MLYIYISLLIIFIYIIAINYNNYLINKKINYNLINDEYIANPSILI